MCVWTVFGRNLTSVLSPSLEEYADLHGQLPEYMVWGLLLDLVKVR